MIAIFDIDGTIFRSSLVIELNDMLIEYGVFPKIVEKELEDCYTNWLDRKGEYEEYLDKLVEIFDSRIMGRLNYDVKKASEAVIEEQKNRVYRYTRDLVKKLRDSHTLIAISGSPIEILELFAKLWKFDYHEGTEHGTDEEGRYTGEVTHCPAKDKRALLMKMKKKHGFDLKGSIGVGDTESDLGFLEEVEYPICFNPNKTLYNIALKKGWKIVVERKNVIYDLDGFKK